MKIVVTGGRDYLDYAAVESVLDGLRIDELFVGDAGGADSCARAWCRENGVPYRTFQADWDQFGKGAGPKRNIEMLEAAGRRALVVAFPGGKGTEHCTKAALQRDMIVLQVKQ